MRRTLLEILCGLAVLVVLSSFHHQLARLKVKEDEVAELRTIVDRAIGELREREALGQRRETTVQALEANLQRLQQEVARAAAGSEEARRLQTELEQVKSSAELVRAQIARDISRTQETVDAYHAEMRSIRTSDRADLQQTREELGSLAAHVRKDPRLLTRELLAPAVQLNGEDTVGSGTLIFSGVNPKSKQTESYVITSFHVIRNILADTPKARHEGIDVTVYQSEKPARLKGDMVAHEAQIDAALLRLRTDEAFPHVARVVSREVAQQVRVWDPIYAVGCPLGNDPIPTQGEVSSLRNELNGTNYWMINAPTYFGNSGGGVFTADTRELVGVFSKIYTHGRGNPVVIPHMGLFTPMPLIYDWLEKQGLEFVLARTGAAQSPADSQVEHVLSPAPR